jgi:DNA polymerase IV (DinB-like DNA polymerase)
VGAGDRARAARAESAATDGDGGKLTDWVGGAPGAEAEADEAGDRGRGEPDDGQASLGDWS